ncbi:hypothetical protein K488DRAFT_76579 [Vararia minispora EC-137]|uniref:Uncharacterized protein n=1 Tax=Vararia minispora EC-137 TaxID=1314806 RepID=A0ACB8QUP1_9AGAM|nr:hypothetical protein K488DRAFT_76579 [Vararia minispora EC-137]
MLIRHHAHRQHVVDSLDTLLYQLHVLSFFLAPSLIHLLARSAIQFQIARPRTIQPQRTLRFWFPLVFLVNLGSVWTHATDGVPSGRSVMLDFVSYSTPPSKMQLLFLDATIIILSLIIVTIAYEASYAASTPSSPDPLAPAPRDRDAFEPAPAPDPLILELRLRTILAHLRSPPPPPPSAPDDAEPLLPPPNTAVAGALPRALALRALMAARRVRRPQQPQQEERGQAREGEGTRRVPGAMDEPD